MEFRGTREIWEKDIYTSENGRETIIVRNLDYKGNRTDIHVRFSAIDETEKETNRANALLISKSPEMLEIIKEYVRLLDGEFSPKTFISELVEKTEILIKEATEL
jgi:hypothetical protein